MLRIVKLILYTNGNVFYQNLWSREFVFNLCKCCIQRKIHRNKRSLITESRLLVTGPLGRGAERGGRCGAALGDGGALCVGDETFLGVFLGGLFPAALTLLSCV